MPDLLSLADAKAHLNITTARHDGELPLFAAAAVRVVERHLDQVLVPREVIERRRLTIGVLQLVLTTTPVLTVTAVTVNGVGWDVGALTVDAGGVLTVRSGAALHGELVITYLVGYTVVPEHYAMAARMVLADLWQSQRPPTAGGTRYGGRGEDDVDMTGGYVLSPAALQLLGHPVPGIA